LSGFSDSISESDETVLSDKTGGTVGTVIRSHAGGYLVYQPELDINLLCQARGRLKKEGVSIVTGDRVTLDDVDPEKGKGVITSCLERENLLSRPLLANVDQVIIVQAIHQPDWNALVCDRYLVHFQLEVRSSLPVLCFNKSDLASEDDKKTLRSIYEPLGYLVTIVSAITGEGMDGLANLLVSKATVFAGPSGVGKSTLLNRLDPELRLKIGVMENDFGVGRHTTTSSELYRISKQQLKGLGVDEESIAWIADTPGFGLSEFKHPEPLDLVWQFPDLAKFAVDCKYSDCTHLVEQGCNVLANLEQIDPTRFDNYSIMVKESQSEKSILRDTSKKVESAVKSVGGREGKAVHVPLLSGRYRSRAKNTERQQLKRSANLVEDEEDIDLEETSDFDSSSGSSKHQSEET
jgi:ribosome biogenesis GTPase